MLPMEYAIITGLCLWAIALELQLRKRRKIADTLANAIYMAARGKARFTIENGKTTIKFNTGE